VVTIVSWSFLGFDHPVDSRTKGACLSPCLTFRNSRFQVCGRGHRDRCSPSSSKGIIPRQNYNCTSRFLTFAPVVYYYKRTIKRMKLLAFEGRAAVNSLISCTEIILSSSSGGCLLSGDMARFACGGSASALQFRFLGEQIFQISGKTGSVMALHGQLPRLRRQLS
jgi:hypothetical protein